MHSPGGHKSMDSRCCQIWGLWGHHPSLLCPHVAFSLCSCLSLLSSVPITWRNMKLALRSIPQGPGCWYTLGSQRPSSKRSKTVTNLQTFLARNQWPGPSASSSSSCRFLQWERVFPLPISGRREEMEGKYHWTGSSYKFTQKKRGGETQELTLMAFKYLWGLLICFDPEGKTKGEPL